MSASWTSDHRLVVKRDQFNRFRVDVFDELGFCVDTFAPFDTWGEAIAAALDEFPEATYEDPHE